MTTARTFHDDEGTFKEWKPSERHCWRPECEAPVQARIWESSDGGYEDYQYRCEKGHVSWVDGIDS